MYELKRIVAHPLWRRTFGFLLILNLLLYLGVQLMNLPVKREVYLHWNQTIQKEVEDLSLEQARDTLTQKQAAVKLLFTAVRMQEFGDEEDLQKHLLAHPELVSQLNQMTTDEREEIRGEFVLLNLWLQRIEYLRMFPADLQKIQEQAKLMRTMGVYQDPSSFEYQNLMKVEKDFSRLEGIPLQLGQDEVLETVMDHPAVLSGLMLMMITVVLLFDERQKNVRPLLWATSGGRDRLRIHQSYLLLLMAVLSTVVFFGFLFPAASLFYGQSLDLNRFAQSLERYRNMTAPMSVGALVILMGVASSLGLYLFGLLFWLVLRWIRHRQAALITVLGFLSLEYAAFTKLQRQDRGAEWAVVNFFSLLQWDPAMRRYRNVSLGMGLWNEKILLGVLTVLILWGLLLILRLQGKKEIKIRQKKHLQSRNRVKIQRDRWVGLEWKKGLIWGGGGSGVILLFLILFLWQLPGTTLTPLERVSEMYSKRLAGPITEEKQRELNQWMQENREEIEETRALPSGDPLKAWKIENAHRKYEALNLMKERMDALAKTKNGEIVPSLPYRVLYGDDVSGVRTGQSLLMGVVFVFLVSPIMGYEKRCGTLELLKSTSGGQRPLLRRKIMQVVLLSGGLWTIWTGWELYFLWKSLGGLEGLFASGTSLSHVFPQMGDHTVMMHLLLFYGWRLMVLLAGGLGILLLGLGSSSTLVTMGLALFLLVIPTLSRVSWSWGGLLALQSLPLRGVQFLMALISIAVLVAVLDWLWRRYPR